MSVIAIIADGTLLAIIAIAVWCLAPLLRRPDWYNIGVTVLLAGLVSYTTAKIVALWYQPALQRPFELLGTTPGAAYLNNPGFPSDHMLLASFLVLTVWWATRRRDVTIGLIILTMVMGVGRVLALVHSVEDIIGGAVLGCVGGVIYILMKNIASPSRQKHNNMIK